MKLLAANGGGIKNYNKVKIKSIISIDEY